MTEQRAYARNTDGTLEIITVLASDDGTLFDRAGYPLVRTDDTVELHGWPDKGVASVWRNDGGAEIIVP